MNKSSPEYLKLADQCLKQFAQTSEDALASLLSTEILNAFEKKSTSRVRHYPALKTLTLFMRQVSNEDKSCRKVLVQESLEQAANDEVSDKTKSDAYCKARKLLPEKEVKSLFRTSGKRLDEESPESWLWHGRRVVIADGTTANMPDTTENEQTYPQSKSQKKEVGFPMISSCYAPSRICHALGYEFRAV